MAEPLPREPDSRPGLAPDDSLAAGGPTLWSVRQVNDLIRGLLTQHLPPTMHVLGEIGDLSRPSSGHLYFTLKDPHSELRCVMWRSSAAKLRFAPEPGMEVIATGSIEVYSPRGSYQLVVRRLEPRGVGALEVAFRQLKERLEREGLFDVSRKRPLPRIPLSIGVVTSPSGAAIRDILQTLRRRYPLARVLVCPVRVQGEGSAAEIAAGIRLLNEQSEALGGIDVLIVGRGGGSIEDLWAFNEEVVARAIAASRIPVVSAVGHEVDVTISDLVADLRAPTPTAAAELVAPVQAELLAAVEERGRRLARIVEHQLALGRADFQSLAARDCLARPLSWLREREQMLDELSQRLERSRREHYRAARDRLLLAEAGLSRFRAGGRFIAAERDLERRLHRLMRTWSARMLSHERRLAGRLASLEHLQPSQRLRLLAERLRGFEDRRDLAIRQLLRQRRQWLEGTLVGVAACDPRQVLRRGYSITRDARTRRVIRSVQEVKPEQQIVTEVADGEFPATIDDPRQPRLFR